jgi:hypothetical protein
MDRAHTYALTGEDATVPPLLHMTSTSSICSGCCRKELMCHPGDERRRALASATNHPKDLRRRRPHQGLTVRILRAKGHRSGSAYRGSQGSHRVVDEPWRQRWGLDWWRAGNLVRWRAGVPAPPRSPMAPAPVHPRRRPPTTAGDQDHSGARVSRTRRGACPSTVAEGKRRRRRRQGTVQRR